MSLAVECHIWIYQSEGTVLPVLDSDHNVAENINDILAISPEAQIIKVDPDMASRINSWYQNQIKTFNTQVTNILKTLLKKNKEQDVTK